MRAEALGLVSLLPGQQVSFGDLYVAICGRLARRHLRVSLSQFECGNHRSQTDENLSHKDRIAQALSTRLVVASEFGVVTYIQIATSANQSAILCGLFY